MNDLIDRRRRRAEQAITGIPAACRAQMIERPALSGGLRDRPLIILQILYSIIAFISHSSELA